MITPPPELVRRADAAKATYARFRGKAWSWKSGITCVHLARFHLRQMGHRPERLPRLRSRIAAVRALRERGWETVSDMLDAQPGLLRITPAEMVIGDLAVVEGSQDGLAAVLVCAGPHKLLGWREDAPALVVLDIELAEISAAWRA